MYHCEEMNWGLLYEISWATRKGLKDLSLGCGYVESTGGPTMSTKVIEMGFKEVKVGRLKGCGIFLFLIFEQTCIHSSTTDPWPTHPQSIKQSKVNTRMGGGEIFLHFKL